MSRFYFEGCSRADIEAELAHQRGMLAENDRYGEVLKGDIAYIEGCLAKMPPFKVGDQVQWRTNDRSETVVAIARMGNKWFVRTDADGDRNFIYDADCYVRAA